MACCIWDIGLKIDQPQNERARTISPEPSGESLLTQVDTPFVAGGGGVGSRLPKTITRPLPLSLGVGMVDC